MVILLESRASPDREAVYLLCVSRATMGLSLTHDNWRKAFKLPASVYTKNVNILSWNKQVLFAPFPQYWWLSLGKLTFLHLLVRRDICFWYEININTCVSSSWQLSSHQDTKTNPLCHALIATGKARSVQSVPAPCVQNPTVLRSYKADAGSCQFSVGVVLLCFTLYSVYIRQSQRKNLCEYFRGKTLLWKWVRNIAWGN